MNKALDYIYHSHTSRCGHAVGEDEEYAKAAKECGFKILGYTDHIILPDLSQPNMRGNPELFDDYISSIRKIEDEYKDDLDIYLGFECEWFDGRYKAYYEKLLKEKVDYLILGEHCYLMGDDFVWYGTPIEDKGEQLAKYEASVIEAMESGLFKFVAHPDVFMQWYPLWDDKCDKVARHIAMKAVELDIPLEINMGNSYRKRFQGRRDYFYPHPRFWKVVSTYPVKVLIGYDTHDPNWIRKGDDEWFLNFAKRNHLNLIDRLSIKKHL